MDSLEDKIKTVDELVPIVEAAKRAGKKVVTSNGVYDFLHAGHVQYLEEARAQGDILILLLNSDESVHILKGPSRPINPQMDRALVLAGLRSIDYVSFFDEDNPGNVLDKLKPSIYTKGGDYDLSKLEETQAVLRHGGELRSLSLKPGYSNSKQFEMIRAAAEAEKNFKRPDWLTAAQKDK